MLGNEVTQVNAQADALKIRQDNGTVPLFRVFDFWMYESKGRSKSAQFPVCVHDECISGFIETVIQIMVLCKHLPD